MISGGLLLPGLVLGCGSGGTSCFSNTFSLFSDVQKNRADPFSHDAQETQRYSAGHRGAGVSLPRSLAGLHWSAPVRSEWVQGPAGGSLRSHSSPTATRTSNIFTIQCTERPVPLLLHPITHLSVFHFHNHSCAQNYHPNLFGLTSS